MKAWSGIDSEESFTKEDFLGNNGNFDLRRFTFNWDGLLRLLKPLDVTLDGILHHGSRMIQVLALRYKSGQGRNRNCIPAIFVGLEKGRVLVNAILAVLHTFIITLIRFIDYGREKVRTTEEQQIPLQSFPLVQ